MFNDKFLIRLGFDVDSKEIQEIRKSLVEFEKLAEKLGTARSKQQQQESKQEQQNNKRKQRNERKLTELQKYRFSRAIVETERLVKAAGGYTDEVKKSLGLMSEQADKVGFTNVKAHQLRDKMRDITREARENALIQRRTTSELEKQARAAKQLGREMRQQLTSRVQMLGLGGVAAAASIGYVGTGVVQQAAEATKQEQQLQTQFEVHFGKDAVRVIDALRLHADEVGANASTLLDGMAKSTAAMVGALGKGGAFQLGKAQADIFAAYGTGQVQQESFAYQLGQIVGDDRTSMADVRVLLDSVPALSSHIREETGKSVKNLVEAGISGAEFAKLVVSFSQTEKTRQALAKNAVGLQAAQNRLANQWNARLRELGRSKAGESLAAAIDELAIFLKGEEGRKSMESFATGVAEILTTFTKALNDNPELISDFMKGLATATGVLVDIVSAFNDVMNYLKDTPLGDMRQEFIAVAGSLVLFGGALTPLIGLMATGYKSLAASMAAGGLLSKAGVAGVAVAGAVVVGNETAKRVEKTGKDTTKGIAGEGVATSSASMAGIPGVDEFLKQREALRNAPILNSLKGAVGGGKGQSPLSENEVRNLVDFYTPVGTTTPEKAAMAQSINTSNTSNNQNINVNQTVHNSTTINEASTPQATSRAVNRGLNDNSRQHWASQGGLADRLATQR